MAQLTTVFLSSTAKDLQPWRIVVAEAIGKLSGFHCVRMEDFGAVDGEPIEVCRRRVAESDVFVGLVGHFNGSSPEGSPLSYTQIEYEEAKKKKKPRLMFMADDEFLLPASLGRETDEAYQRQRRFREQVQRERTVVFFNEPLKLATLVVAALQNSQKELKKSGGKAGREGRTRAVLRGSGGLAQGTRAVAAGEGGIAAGRDVTIVLGSSQASGPDDPSLRKAYLGRLIEKTEYLTLRGVDLLPLTRIRRNLDHEVGVIIPRVARRVGVRGALAVG